MLLLGSEWSGAIVALLIYVLFCLPLFVVAIRIRHEYAWLAFVPIASAWLLCDIADLPAGWFALMICLSVVVPASNIFLFLYLIVLAVSWMRVSDLMDKPPWMGVLLILPFVGIGAAYYISYYDSDLLPEGANSS